MKKSYRIFVMLFAGFISLIGFQITVNAEAISNELLIEYEETRQTFSLDETVPGVESRETITEDIELWSFTDATDMESMKQQLQEDPNVLHVEPNYERYTHEITLNDPILVKQWWIPQVKPQLIWSRVNEQQKDVIVAVIDSGIDLQHEDLQGRIQPGGYNFHGNNSTPQDFNGHGTAVAGVIAATAGNNLGVAGITGMYKTKVLPLKISHQNGISKVSDGIRAIDYAIEKKVDVINLSFGSSKSSYLEEQTIQRAIQAGITVVASAGNDATKGNSIMFPASYPTVISVGATNRKNERTWFSNYNQHISVVAPGEAILTTTIDNSYKLVSGTSFSGPMVAGGAALVKILQPQATPTEIKQLLELTSTDLGVTGKDEEHGAGLLNLKRLDYALTLSANINRAGGFIGDFPELEVNTDKVFKISFTDELKMDKEYQQHLYIVRSTNSPERVEGFTAQVNPLDTHQLLVKPNSEWQQGVHYLFVDKGLQNKKSISLKKSYTVKFTVIPD